MSKYGTMGQRIDKMWWHKKIPPNEFFLLYFESMSITAIFHGLFLYDFIMKFDLFVIGPLKLLEIFGILEG